MSFHTELGNEIDVLSGFAWKAAQFQNDRVGLPIIRIQNVGSEAERDFVFWPGEYKERFVVSRGDVLLTLSGSFRLAEWRGEDALLNQRIVKLTPSDRLDKRFFIRFMETQLAKIESMGRHALVNNVSVTDIKKFVIPVPPLGEQKRIAKILDTADALRAKRRESLAQLDALLQSTFLDLFGDPVANPMNWPSDIRLDDVADIASGITKGRKLKDGESLREVPYLAVANVQDKHLKLDAVKSIRATSKEIERYRLLKNDLLLTEGGDPDKLGRGTLWGDELEDCIHQNHVFRVRLKTKEVNPVFLSWIVGSARGKQYFMRSAKQTTGIASINMTQLRAFPMLIPPLELQNQFAEIANSIERQRKKVQDHAFVLDTLFSSMQQIAFSGKL